MIGSTISGTITVGGGAQATLLARRYRIVRQLGQGGMGSVWLAEDTQLDGKLFAIKMLPSILVSNKRAYSQLKAEALVSMRLTHPNIVTLRAFEENNGNPFLVMDYIDGQTLDDYLADRMAGDAGRARTPAAPHGGDGTGRCAEEAQLRSGRFSEAEPEGCASIRARTPAAPLDDVVGRVVPNAPRRLEDKPPYQNALPSESEVIRILKPIAEALDYAHREGVVHRDIKPANVMIRKDGHPFILDFGIAREIQETMTRVTGKLSSGTLLYMSPEQLNGDAPKAPQDIYSFAAMVYECLTGHPPFHRGAIEDQIKNKEPEPIGRARIPAAPHGGGGGALVGRVVPNAPHGDDRYGSARTPAAPSIAPSVMAGLAKRPENRPPTCAAVLVGGDCFNAETQRRRGAERAEAGLVRAEHVERVERREAGRGEIVEDRPEKTNGFGKTLVGLLMFAVLGGAVWFATKNGEDMSERSSVQPPVVTNAVVNPPPPPSGPTAVDVTEISVEASVQKGRIGRIDDADGFKARKIQLADLLTEAVSYGKVKRWDKAAAGFTNYVDKCKALTELDRDRNKARDARNKSMLEKERAETAESSKYASVRWNAALKIAADAVAAFEDMRFSDATRFYGMAMKQFEICAEDSKKERRRQETVRLENERNAAGDARARALSASKRAEQAGAKKYARTSWNAAAEKWKEAVAELERNRFADAAAKFSELERMFDSCAREAEKERQQQESVRLKDERCKHRTGDVKTIALPGGAKMEMVYVSPGKFTIGASDRLRSAYLGFDALRAVEMEHGLWIGRTEVTQKQWYEVMQGSETGATTKSLMSTIQNDQKTYLIGGKYQTLRSFYEMNGNFELKLHSDNDDMPIYYVSWFDAMKFCKRLKAYAGSSGFQLSDGYECRLPTVDEWEIACRAGKISDIPNGMSYDLAHMRKAQCPALDDFAWYEGNAAGCLHNVALKKGNDWGLYDMLGNVFEWCYGDGGDEAPIRGGSYKSGSLYCLPSSRGKWNRAFKMNSLGFRIVLAQRLSVAMDEARIAKDPSIEKTDEVGKVKAERKEAQKGVQLWPDGPYWAEMNIGAEKPWEYGYYFWWGDTVGYKRVNDKWVASNGSRSGFSFEGDNTPTSNKSRAALRNEGWITADGVLALKHDAAQAHWGGNWRMPTEQELNDLKDKCDWNWTKINCVNGYRVSGRGAYSSAIIFLPAAGFGYGTSLDYAGSYGYYWSSVPYSDYYLSRAWSLNFNSGRHDVDYSFRYIGQSVRAVQGFTK